MPSKDEDTVLLSEEIGLSESQPDADQDAVVYDQQVARGESNVESGDQVVVVSDELAQGPSVTDIEFRDIEGVQLTADTLLYVGETTTLRCRVQNNTDQDVTDYELTFLENSSGFTTQSATLPAGDTVEFTVDRTKSDAGCFLYQAEDNYGNSTNTLEVCWLNIRPGEFTAVPEYIYLGSSDKSSTLTMPVENPGSEPNSKDITVNILDTDANSTIYSETQNISPGDTYDFSTTVSEDSETVRTFKAEVINEESGRGGKSLPETVVWEASDTFVIPDYAEQKDSGGGSTDDVAVRTIRGYNKLKFELGFDIAGVDIARDWRNAAVYWDGWFHQTAWKGDGGGDTEEGQGCGNDTGDAVNDPPVVSGTASFQPGGSAVFELDVRDAGCGASEGKVYIVAGDGIAYVDNPF